MERISGNINFKSLAEIELDYVRNIIEFFCREYPIHVKFNKNSDYKKSELEELISKQIHNRLVHSNLIKNYKVQINVYPKDERRNCQIDNVLENQNKPIDIDYQKLEKYF